MTKHMLLSLLSALAIVTLAACGGAGDDATASDSEPATSGDEGAMEPSGDETAGTADGSESCYVVSVDDQEGCWDDADTACDEVCGAPCVCTEATANNTCGC